MLILTKTIGLLFTPPAILILGVLVGLVVRLRFAFVGKIVIALSIVGLLILSLPVTGRTLLGMLEKESPALPSSLGFQARQAAQAIVVLGAGRATKAPGYGGDTVSALSLERLRYAARLHRATGLPILVTGGSPFGEQTSEAELMQKALREDFQLGARWLETRSRTTNENALYSKAVLAGAGINRVYLVTHAWHMPRSVWAFKNAGLSVVPAPTGFTTTDQADRTILGYLPTAEGLMMSSRAVHERLGLELYK